MNTVQGLRKTDWELIYEIGGKIHEELFKEWSSTAATYAKDANTMKIMFMINENGKRSHYPLELPLSELRSLRVDSTQIASQIIATFQEALS